MTVPGITGKRVVITGAAGGIGAAVCESMRAAGALVHPWDLVGNNEISAVDVTDRDAVARAWTQTIDEHGSVDVVIHGAGVMSNDWDLCMAVNAGGVRNMLDVAVPSLVERGTGSVVVISSNAAATPRAAIPAYAASKAAATAYARSVGLDVARSGVRINVVSPGSTDTPMLRGMWADEVSDRAAVLAGDPDRFRLGIPLGRIADATDIAATVQFLASDAAKHMTMHDLRVDGGATLDQ